MNSKTTSDQQMFTIAGFLGDLSIAFNFKRFEFLALSDKAYCFVVWGILIGVFGNAFLPYEYYMALRSLICAVSAYYFFRTKNGEGKINIPAYLTFGLLGCAVLYNPVLPVHLGSQFLWLIANIATLGLLYSVRQTFINGARA
ncbi:DUF6804 family protein [Profundibacter sp.]